ncbi:MULTISPECIES: sulfite exporter TauE/SafE family protein [unclassified Leisingera]|uniref:sulfite exporter TauE/SafE family protein n=1 Tax=unclassified Leisingera TaxID=2614906 RepID=UPI000301C2F4|nr:MULTISPECIES: sulfite exporter TauE/SafE family protein [unclassified Leisingera]KIC24562.1 membrane protein [Leisingera sp. ANG-S3]KIC55580.1 membrane protein [Leisingera sp. ANG-S]KID09313.1 membrane protein [Leisingera sp. ANG1]
MAAFDAMFFVFAIPAVVFAGVSKGGFGSGAAFASASILALVLEPGMALALMLPLLMLIDVANLKPYWGRWNLRASLLLIGGGLPGVALGAWLYAAVDADAMRVLIGLVSVCFVLWQLRGRLRLRLAADAPLSTGAGALAGLAVGFTSFVSHAGGPPAAVYLLSLKLRKTEYQASTVLIFWAINIAKAVPYAGLGMFTRETLLLDLMLAPFALLGAWLGVKLHHSIPERWFFALTYVLLTVTGAKLIWDGLA